MHSEKEENGSVGVIYKFFGLDIISNYPFAGYQNCNIDNSNPAKLSSTVYFACNKLPPFPVDWKEGKEIFSQKYRTANGEVWDKLYHFSTYDVFRFAWGADFYLASDRIDCHLRNPAYQSSVEPYLLGIVLSFWLERMGILTLHSSAVVIDDLVAAFPLHSGYGKSTLAATFLQAGAALLTDDILPIEKQEDKFWGHPGPPQVNLWPDQAAHFIDNREDFIPVLPGILKRRVPVKAIKNGTFCHERLPLACMYIPSKSYQPTSEPNIVITPVPPAEAVIELVRYSFIAPAIAKKMGWQGRRLEFFARLVEQIPVRRLHYPAGFEHLPRVTEAVLQDLKGFPSR